MSSPKRPRFNEVEAWQVARPIQLAMERVCDRVEIAGSLRRRNPTVGDIELLYIPKFSEARDGLFDTVKINMADVLFEAWLKDKFIAKRPNKNGLYAWGEKNKLAIHVASGIPIDFFATTESNWHNSLVIRTGGKETNLLLTTRAQARGWSLEAYGSGFRHLRTGEHYQTKSEEDVFRFLDLPFKEPRDRE